MDLSLLSDLWAISRTIPGQRAAEKVRPLNVSDTLQTIGINKDGRRISTCSHCTKHDITDNLTFS